MIKIKMIIAISTMMLLKVHAQNVCGKVMYRLEVNLDLYSQVIYVTNFNNEEACTKLVPWKEAKPFFKGNYDPEFLFDDEDFFETTSNGVVFVYNTKKESYFSSDFLGGYMKIKEEPFAWKWKLLGEQKKIGDYNCQNASIYFRGRTYIAWFTTDIPVPFGPWKFKGLPGLILEMHTKKNNWSMTALKVNLKKTKQCSIDFDKKQIEKTISVRSYLKKVDSLTIDNYKKYATRKLTKNSWLPDGCVSYRNGGTVEIWKRYNQYK